MTGARPLEPPFVVIDDADVRLFEHADDFRYYEDMTGFEAWDRTGVRIHADWALSATVVLKPGAFEPERLRARLLDALESSPDTKVDLDTLIARVRQIPEEQKRARIAEFIQVRTRPGGLSITVGPRGPSWLLPSIGVVWVLVELAWLSSMRNTPPALAFPTLLVLNVCLVALTAWLAWRTRSVDIVRADFGEYRSSGTLVVGYESPFRNERRRYAWSEVRELTVDTIPSAGGSRRNVIGFTYGGMRVRTRVRLDREEAEWLVEHLRQLLSEPSNPCDRG